MALPLHKIAAGNNNTAGLTLVTSLSDSGYTLPAPRALGSYSPGIVQPRGNFSVTTAGVASIEWTWDILDRVAWYKFFQTTYCGSALNSLSGLVTIYTPVRLATEYYRYNATLILPAVEALRYEGDTDWVRDFTLTFTNLEVV